MKTTLLVISAGMGSRYGGLKQIAPVGPGGECIIDYSMYDAIRAGFDRLVFVIRRDFEQTFKEKIGSKLDGIIEVDYAYQQLDSCVGGYDYKDRQKPWGTGHAVLVAKDVIDGPFAVINADDYYGSDSMKIVIEHLKGGDVSNNNFAMVGYVLRNTLSDYGSVCRGICQLDGDNMLNGVVERVGIEKIAEGAKFTDEDGKEILLSGDEIASMNFWGFGAGVFDYLQEQFDKFLVDRGGELKSEFYLPAAVDVMIHKDQASVKVLPTLDKWFGMTYMEDKQTAIAKIAELIKKGLYPERLWAKL